MQEIREFKCFKVNGFAVLAVHLLILILGVVLLILGVSGQVMSLWIAALPTLALALLLTFGYFAVEAMAMGKPVVVSDCPAQADVIDTARCGLIHKADDPASLAEKIIYLIDNEKERLTMGENGKKAISETWDWQFKSKDLLDFYRGQAHQLDSC